MFFLYWLTQVVLDKVMLNGLLLCYDAVDLVPTCPRPLHAVTYVCVYVWYVPHMCVLAYVIYYVYSHSAVQCDKCLLAEY